MVGVAVGLNAAAVRVDPEVLSLSLDVAVESDNLDRACELYTFQKAPLSLWAYAEITKKIRGYSSLKTGRLGATLSLMLTQNKQYKGMACREASPKSRQKGHSPRKKSYVSKR